MNGDILGLHSKWGGKKKCNIKNSNPLAHLLSGPQQLQSENIPSDLATVDFSIGKETSFWLSLGLHWLEGPLTENREAQRLRHPDQGSCEFVRNLILPPQQRNGRGHSLRTHHCHRKVNVTEVSDIPAVCSLPAERKDRASPWPCREVDTHASLKRFSLKRDTVVQACNPRTQEGWIRWPVRLRIVWVTEFHRDGGREGEKNGGRMVGRERGKDRDWETERQREMDRDRETEIEKDIEWFLWYQPWRYAGHSQACVLCPTAF